METHGGKGRGKLVEGLKEVGEGEDSRVSIEGSGGAGKKEMGDAAVAG